MRTKYVTLSDYNYMRWLLYDRARDRAASRILTGL